MIRFVDFNDLLRLAGLDPAEVRLVRHRPEPEAAARAAHALYRRSPARFLRDYAGYLPGEFRKELAAPWQALFVVDGGGRTVFAGLCAAYLQELQARPHRCPVRGGQVRGRRHDLYRLEPDRRLDLFAGRLEFDWGRADRPFVQKADRRPKPLLGILPAG